MSSGDFTETELIDVTRMSLKREWDEADRYLKRKGRYAPSSEMRAWLKRRQAMIDEALRRNGFLDEFVKRESTA